MTSTESRSDVETAPEPGRRRASKPPRRLRRHRRTILLVIVVLLLSMGVVGGVWSYNLAKGLLASSRVVQDKAAVAQTELQLFKDTLKAGDEPAAIAHLKAGETALADAKAAAQSKDVRTAKGLPYVGNTVRDLDHLLAAATILTRSGRDALAVYENFSGADSKLFANGAFSIPAITEAQQSVASIRHALDLATTELNQVTGKGPKGSEALAKKKTALAKVASSRRELDALSPVLQSLPTTVGASGKKTYLIAIMNPAEMRASGGAPLSVAFVSFANGKMTIVKKGSTSALTRVNAQFFWKRLTGKDDPFQPPAGQPQRFVNTNVNPDFAVSGEQMVRATPVNFGIKTDGVIALDITALGHLLDVTGPIKTKFYGTITGKNIVQKLVVKAYTFGSDDSSVAARHDINNKLMTQMLGRLTKGGGLIGKARALGLAVPGRHLQLYFRDPSLQKVVVDKGLGGTQPVRDSGNLTAVYTQNGNGNKMDVFQKRTVSEKVVLRADGSATVTRTIRLENPTPPYNSTLAYADRHRGYDTRWATNLVINLMPKGAKLVKQPTAARFFSQASGVVRSGLTFADAAVTLPPNSSVQLTWSYTLPHAADVVGNRMFFRDYVAPQSMTITPTLNLTVVPPAGWSSVPREGWAVGATGVSTTVPIDAPQVLKLNLRKQ